MNRLDAVKAPLAGNPRSEDAIVEVPVLLESRLLKAVEAAARAEGMTAGTLVRRLLRDFLFCPDSDLPAPCATTKTSTQGTN